MIRSQEVIWCDGCGVEILWPPLVIDARPYCCLACAEGCECHCDERQSFDEQRRTGVGAAVSGTEAAYASGFHGTQ